MNKMAGDKDLTISFSIGDTFPMGKWYVNRDLPLALLVQDAVIHFYKFHTDDNFCTPYESAECLYAETMIANYDLFMDFSTASSISKEDSYFLYSKEDYLLHFEAMFLACQDYFLQISKQYKIPLYKFINFEVIKASGDTIVMRLPK